MRSKSAFITTTVLVGVMIFSACAKKVELKSSSLTAKTPSANEIALQRRINRLEQELAIKDQKLKSLGLLDNNKNLKNTEQLSPKLSTGVEKWQK